MRYSNLVKTFISRNILHQTWYTCPVGLPVHWNPQHRMLLTVASATSASRLASPATFERPWENFSTAVNGFTRQTFRTRKHEASLYEYPSHCVLLHTKTHDITLLFSRTLLKHSRHFNYWNQPLNMHVRVWCLGCHEAGLWCYLVMHRENLLVLPLQLFYIHLYTVYRLSRFSYSSYFY
jgi:hypothetical protein